MCLYLELGYSAIVTMCFFPPLAPSAAVSPLSEDCLCVRQERSLCFFLIPLSLYSLSLHCPPTVCLLTWPRVFLGPDPVAPLLVCVCRMPPTLSTVMCYQWDLPLSVSASAARRRSNRM